MLKKTRIKVNNNKKGVIIVREIDEFRFQLYIWINFLSHFLDLMCGTRGKLRD